MADIPRVMAGSLEAGRPGDTAASARAVLARVREAADAGAELLVLPEMCLCGLTCGDLAAQPLMAEACRKAADDIARETAGLTLVLGLPMRMGTGVYNAAAVMGGGRWQGLVLKETLSPRERRVFSRGSAAPAEGWPCPVSAGRGGPFRLPSGRALSVAFTGGEGKHASGDLVALVGAEPAAAGDGWARLKRLRGRAEGLLCAWANAGANESTTDQVYDGQALILRDERVLAEAAPFSGAAALTGRESPVRRACPVWQPDPAMPYAPPEGEARAVWCREALEIAARGLACRMARIGARGVSLGLSGGLDSAMALLISLRAFEINGLDKGALFAVSLPAFGTSAKTRDNARALLEACGLMVREIDLTASLTQHLKDIAHPEGRHDAAFENAQARERTQVLMDIANQIGGIMVGPGDMSELALGFTTYGGDHMSMYGVNAGLYKSAIRLIVAQHARDCENAALARALTDILDTPISPELIPGEGGSIKQKTEDILGPYVLNDFFLHHFLMGAGAPGLLLEKALMAFGPAFSRQEILGRMRGFFTRFFASQFKRSCMPDGPQALGLSLSPRGGLDMPSDAAAHVWTAAVDALIDQSKGE